MSGTKAGGAIAKQTIKAKYGVDFWAKIGAIGGKRSRGGGFAYMKLHQPEKLKKLSRRGGQNGSRGPVRINNG